VTFRRQILLSFMLVALFYTTPVLATGVTPKVEQSQGVDEITDFDLSLGPDYLDMPEMPWADSVMMTRLPPGSLFIKFDGPQKLIVKHARSQVRRYARKYRKYSVGASPQIDVWNKNVDLNAWWTRSWMDSLPSGKGGAPDRPYVHTIGSEITWRLGPLTVSNMLRLKIDYIAVFKFNPDPGDKSADSDPPPVSLDVRPTRGTTIGTRFRVKVRPTIRVGMPKSDGWLSVIRSISIRAEIDIVVFGIHFVRGEVVLKYEPADDHELSLNVGLAVVNW